MKILTMAASLRKDSLNQKLITSAEKILESLAIEVDRARFADFDMPLYNGDIDKADSKPAGVSAFAERLKKNDALVLASPEYNFSMPGTIKNLIDWISRVKPQPWDGTKVLLMSASPSLAGGNRGLWALRVPIECCGAIVYPEMFSLAKAHEAFKPTGELAEAVMQERLEKNIKAFVGFLKKLTV